MTEIVEYDENQERPNLLLVLAILSFVSIGFAILGNLWSITGGPMTEAELIEQSVEMAQSKTQMRDAGMYSFVTFFDKLEGMIIDTNEHFYFSKMIAFITDFIGLFGVIFMLRRRKLGFHLYIVYSLLALGGMYLYVSPENVHISLPIVSIIFTGIFVYLYSRTLHWMR